jgi:hypothetical protein
MSAQQAKCVPTPCCNTHKAATGPYVCDGVLCRRHESSHKARPVAAQPEAQPHDTLQQLVSPSPVASKPWHYTQNRKLTSTCHPAGPKMTPLQPRPLAEPSGQPGYDVKICLAANAGTRCQPQHALDCRPVCHLQLLNSQRPVWWTRKGGSGNNVSAWRGCQDKGYDTLYSDKWTLAICQPHQTHNPQHQHASECSWVRAPGGCTNAQATPNHKASIYPVDSY